MKLLLTKLILLIPLIFSTSVQSETYKWVDEEGNTHFSDRKPFENADVHFTSEINTTPAVKAIKTQVTEKTIKETVYQSFKIASPEHNATIRNNQGNFAISLALQPPLNIAQGHSISVLLNNKIIQDNLTSLSTQFNNIDRGTHQVSASIKNKQGKVLLSTENISIHIHRKSVLNP